jgi:hypothetical protein
MEQKAPRIQTGNQYIVGLNQRTQPATVRRAKKTILEMREVQKMILTKLLSHPCLADS